MNKLTQQELDKIKSLATRMISIYFENIDFRKYVDTEFYNKHHTLVKENSAVFDAIYAIRMFTGGKVYPIFDLLDQEKVFADIKIEITDFEDEEFCWLITNYLMLTGYSKESFDEDDFEDLTEEDHERFAHLAERFRYECDEFLADKINDITLDEINKHIEERMT